MGKRINIQIPFICSIQTSIVLYKRVSFPCNIPTCISEVAYSGQLYFTLFVPVKYNSLVPTSDVIYMYNTFAQYSLVFTALLTSQLYRRYIKTKHFTQTFTNHLYYKNGLVKWLVTLPIYMNLTLLDLKKLGDSCQKYDCVGNQPH